VVGSQGEDCQQPGDAAGKEQRLLDAIRGEGEK